jgi:hypothetical protein
VWDGTTLSELRFLCFAGPKEILTPGPNAWRILSSCLDMLKSLAISIKRCNFTAFNSSQERFANYLR